MICTLSPTAAFEHVFQSGGCGHRTPKRFARNEWSSQPTPTSHENFPQKSANLISSKQEDVMAKGNNARKKETKKPKKDKK
jgi:hypothetical protein